MLMATPLKEAAISSVSADWADWIELSIELGRLKKCHHHHRNHHHRIVIAIVIAIGIAIVICIIIITI